MSTASPPYTGTAAMGAEIVNLNALEAWLRANVAGFAGPVTIERFKGGQSNPTYKLTTPHCAYVMRSKPAPIAKLLPSAHAIEREYRVQAALAGSEVPVARMLALCEDETVCGRAFYVMSHVEGRVLWDQALPGMNSYDRAAIYSETNRVMAALHRIDVGAVGLANFGRPGSYFSRQITRWTRQYQQSATEEIQAMDRLIEWLPARIPRSEEVAIIHGDFRMDNMVLHPSEPVALAVLDWELATIGDPLADFAYHCLAWHIEPGEFRGIAGLDAAALGIPSEKSYIAQYCQHSGRDPDAVVEHWDFYIVFNLFRLAAILQGIMKRVVDGTASSDNARAEGQRARGLAEKAWRIAARSKV